MSIYIVRMGDTQFYKVGWILYDAHNRIRQLQIGNPLPLVLVRMWEYGTQKQEAHIHHILSNYRSGGGSEWFNLPMNVAEELIACQNYDEYFSIIRRHAMEQIALEHGLMGNNNGKDKETSQMSS